MIPNNAEEPQKTIRGYKLLRKIGSGATANVFKAHKDKQDFALKVFKNAPNMSMETFNREVDFATRAPHAFAARPIEAFVESDGNEILPCIAYELAPNGDMFSNLEGSGRLPMPIMKFYAKQLIAGIDAMHKAGICHRDLKLENLVLDAEYNLKIIDFGLASSIEGEESSGFSQDRVGSPGYMAPEIVMGMRYQPASADLFSLGVIIFTMCTGVMPFRQADCEDKYYLLIATGKQNLFWAAHEAHNGAPFSANFKELMNYMFAYQPFQRLNLAEVIGHPFFNEGATMASHQTVKNHMIGRGAQNN